MNKNLEQLLWDSIPEAYDAKNSVRDIIERMFDTGVIANRKQAWRTLEKWADRGLYDYGVCLDLGWKVKDKP